MELHIVIQGQKDLGGQLYAQLREAIDSGRLAAGARLPPSRLLAEQLGLSRKTVSDIYAQLTYEGVLVGRVGSGTFVNARVPRHEQRPQAIRYAAQEAIDTWEALQTRIVHPHAGVTLRADFLGGASSLNTFPHEDWRRCVHFALRQMQGPRAVYAQPEGLPSLRDAIARHIAYSRGVQCRDEDVIVCNGAQQALDLGLVNQVVPDDKLVATVDALVEEIATLSPRYLEIAKVSSNVWWNAARDNFLSGLGMLVQAVGSDDMIEGATSFLEKRRPTFPPPR